MRTAKELSCATVKMRSWLEMPCVVVWPKRRFRTAGSASQMPVLEVRGHEVANAPDEVACGGALVATGRPSAYAASARPRFA